MKWAVVSLAVSVVGMLVLAVVFVSRAAGPVFFCTDKLLLRKLFSFSIRSHVGQIFVELQDRFDIFIVAYFLTTREVGLYSVALALANILCRLPRVAASVLLPRLVQEKEQKNSIQLTARLNRVLFATTAAMTLVFSLLVGWIVGLLFGTEFEAANNAVLWLLPGVLFQTLYSICHNDMIMRGQASRFSFAVFLGLMVMVVGDLLLIPRFGITGAACASTIGWLVTGLYVFINVYRNNSLSLGKYFDIRPEIKILLGMPH